jgi:peptidoglycan/LPS O-acetylase OafA/YrhL
MMASLYLRALVVLGAVAFAIGSLSHAGIDVPLGFTTIDEPSIGPATFVEGVIALTFAIAAFAVTRRRPWAREALRTALLVGIGGVLLGMGALAAGRGPRTELNDLFHVVALGAMFVGWSVASSDGGRRALAPRRDAAHADAAGPLATR